MSNQSNDERDGTGDRIDDGTGDRIDDGTGDRIDDGTGDRIDDGTGSTTATLGRLEEGSERACCEGSAIDDRRPDPEAVANEEAVFKALANEKRLAVVHALRDGELCACDLEAVLDAPQSTVATHLRKLRDAGIVRTRKDGKWTHYRIADTASLQLIDLAAALGGES